MNQDDIISEKVYIYNKGQISQNPLNPKKKSIIIIISSIVVSLAVIISLIIFFVKKSTSRHESSPITERKLKGEPGYSFKMQIGQFNRIFIDQKYNETRLRNEKNLTIFFGRKTIYNIYVISEKEPDESKSHLYSKIYTCAVSIESECTSHTDENCKTRTIVDLIGESTQNEEIIRHLQ